MWVEPSYGGFFMASQCLHDVELSGSVGDGKFSSCNLCATVVPGNRKQPRRCGMSDCYEANSDFFITDLLGGLAPRDTYAENIRPENEGTLGILTESYFFHIKVKLSLCLST